MNKNNCYVATSKDKEIAAKLKEAGIQRFNPNNKNKKDGTKRTNTGKEEYFTGQDIAFLRGIYDEIHPEEKIDIENEDIDSIIDKIYTRNTTLNGEVPSVSEAEAFISISKVFGPTERVERINFVNYLFREYVNRALKMTSFQKYSREKFIGKYSDKIYKSVANSLHKKAMQYYSEMMTTEDVLAKKRWEEAVKILINWDAMVALSKMYLKPIEGMVFGIHSSFATEATPAEFSEDDLSDQIDLEESEREHWQEIQDRMSAFGSLGQLTRRVLSSIPSVAINKDGVSEPNRGLFGELLYIDPLEAHQKLSEHLRNVTTEESLIKKLRKLAQTEQFKWVNVLLKELTYDPGKSPEYNNSYVAPIRTAFVVDFRKNFINYVIGYFKSDTYHNKIINEKRNERLTTTAIRNIKKGKTQLTTSEGKVYFKKENKELLNQLIEDVEFFVPGIFEYLSNPQIKVNVKHVDVFNRDTSTYTKEDLAIATDFIDRLTRLLTNAGFGSNELKSNIEALFYSGQGYKKNLRTITEAVARILKYEIPGQEEQGTVTSVGSNATALKNYINRIEDGATSTYSLHLSEKLKSQLDIISNILSPIANKAVTERKARYIDPKGNKITLYADVAPSYLGDFVANIKNCESTKELQQVLKKFTDSPLFMDTDDKHLCFWLRDLLNPENQFAQNIEVSKFLGSSKKAFENFSKKEHLLSIINNFYYPSLIGKQKGFAWYPTFILGDSGVTKNITAPIYSEDEIIEGYYRIYLHETKRQKLTKEFNEDLDKKGYEHNHNLDNNSNKFTLLPFLNNDKRVTQNSTKDEIKDIIKEHLEKAEKKFLKELKDENIITYKEESNGEITGFGAVKAEYLKQLGAKEKQLNNLHNFFINYKFAMLNQLMLMTVDNAFYDGITDLQKRYKEIHAPGIALNLAALDSKGNNFIEDEDKKESVAYIKDIKLNAEEHDPVFLQSVLYHFGDPAKRSKIIKAIENKITDKRNYKGTEEERVAELKDLLGDNYRIYETYTKKSSLTDGQAWRSLKSYRGIMGASGKWTADMQMAYEQIEEATAEYLDQNKEVPPEVYERLLSLSAIFQPIKPYLYTLEEYDIIKENGAKVKMLIPVQHKNSEAVLIPILQQGKLRDMGMWARKQNVDVIMADSCVKVGAFGQADISSVKNIDDLNKALQSACIHKLNMSDYRIQTNVPEHIHSSRLMGTQLRKILLANLKKDRYNNYFESFELSNDSPMRMFKSDDRNIGVIGEMTKENLLRVWNSLITTNIIEDYQKVKKIIQDPKIVSELLQQSTLNSGRASVQTLIASALNEEGDFFLPLFESGVEKDAAAYLFSYFRNKVNKQKILGGSGVQASALGLEGYEETGGLRYVTDPENEHNILYAECEMPWSLSYTVKKDGKEEEVQLNFLDYCDPDGTLKLDSKEITDEQERKKYLSYAQEKDGRLIVKKPLIEVDYPGILSLVAYRIPSEREYSAINLKVKRFTPLISGGTIKVPFQGTAIAGFDFDIDKLYFIRKEFTFKYEPNPQKVWEHVWKKYPDIKDSLLNYRNEHGDPSQPLHSYWDVVIPSYSKTDVFNEVAEELSTKENLIPTYNYDIKKTPINNTRAARNNMLLHIMQQRLEDEETFSGRYCTQGFPEASAAAKNLRTLKEETEDWDASDPGTLVHFNAQNQIAAKLIGIFANHNSNHAFVKSMQEFDIKQPLEIFGYKDRTSFINPPQGVLVDNNVAELLAASVDAVKDPVLNDLNLNSATASMGAVLIRLGYSMEEVGLFFNQPVVREFCKRCDEQFADPSTILAEMSKSYKEVTKKMDYKYKGNQAYYFSKEYMKKTISNYKNKSLSEITDKEEDLYAQSVLLTQLISLQDIAQEVTAFMGTTKYTASNAVGSEFGSFYQQQQKLFEWSTKRTDTSKLNVVVSDLYHRGLEYTPKSDEVMNSIDAYIQKVYAQNFAYEQAMFDCNRDLLKALAKYFPYETPQYTLLRKAAQDVSIRSSLPKDIINELHREFPLFLMMNGFYMNPNMSVSNIVKTGFITRKDYYTTEFPKKLMELKDSVFEDSSGLTDTAKTFLASLDVEEIFKNNKPTEIIIGMNNSLGYSSSVKDDLSFLWQELIQSDNALDREIGIGVMYYNLYKYGFSPTPKSMWHLLSSEIKHDLVIDKDEYGNNITYSSFLQNLLNNTEASLNTTMNNFLKLFILNNLDSSVFIKRLDKLGEDLVKNAQGESLQIPSELNIDFNSMKEEDISILGVGRQENKNGSNQYTYIWPPVLQTRTDNGTLFYWMLQNNNSDDIFTKTTRSQVTYMRVEPIGKKNEFSNYDISTIETPTETGIVLTEDDLAYDKYHEDNKKLNSDKDPSINQSEEQYIIEQLKEQGIHLNETAEYSSEQLRALAKTFNIKPKCEVTNKLVC